MLIKNKNFLAHTYYQTKIDPYQFIELFHSKRAFLVDVRSDFEYDLWNVEYAKHIPLSKLVQNSYTLPKEKLIVTVCSDGVRSNVARRYLELKGFETRFLENSLIELLPLLKKNSPYEIHG